MTIQRWKSVFWLTLGTLLMTVGYISFKFPNNFTFGGVTGFAVLIAKFVPLSASDVVFRLNLDFAFVGFIFFGKRFGAKTAYTSVLLSVTLLRFWNGYVP